MARTLPRKDPDSSRHLAPSVFGRLQNLNARGVLDCGYVSILRAPRSHRVQ